MLVHSLSVFKYVIANVVGAVELRHFVSVGARVFLALQAFFAVIQLIAIADFLERAVVRVGLVDLPDFPLHVIGFVVGVAPGVGVVTGLVMQAEFSQLYVIVDSKNIRGPLRIVGRQISAALGVRRRVVVKRAEGLSFQNAVVVCVDRGPAVQADIFVISGLRVVADLAQRQLL